MITNKEISRARIGFWLMALGAYLMSLQTIDPFTRFGHSVYFSLAYAGAFLIVDGFFIFMEETG